MRLRFVPGISVRFQTLSQFGGQLALALLALPPLSFSGIATQKRTVRLACLIHAASVRSEPESNSPNIEIFARADPLGGPGLCFGLNTILFFYKHELFAVGPASRLPVSSAPGKRLPHLCERGNRRMRPAARRGMRGPNAIVFSKNRRLAPLSGVRSAKQPAALSPTSAGPRGLLRMWENLSLSAPQSQYRCKKKLYA